MNFFKKYLILCCIVLISSNVFAMEEHPQDPQHFFTSLYFEGGDVELAPSEFNLQFSDGRKIKVKPEELTSTFEQFMVEMTGLPEELDDSETERFVVSAAKDFSKELKAIIQQSIDAGAKYGTPASSCIPIYISSYNGTFKSAIYSWFDDFCGEKSTPQNLFSEASVIILGLLNPCANFINEPALILQYLRGIPTWFNNVIKLSIAQKMKCLPDTYEVPSSLKQDLGIRETVSREEYNRRVFTIFNDAKLISFAMKVAYNFIEATRVEMKDVEQFK
ncbi:MAG: hypothetical protein WCS92_00730 [Candidatus Babeliales bacterium]|jgi:hypothetical protein|nr:MAG: hypothetical protein US22_C0012G0005 [candidate division TM6 bacterium GW2011_GWF2_36_6]